MAGTETISSAKKDAPHLWLGLHLDGRAVFLAGLGAGLGFLLLEVITAFVLGVGTSLGPAYATLKGLVGAESGPGQYNLGLVLAGLFVHFSLSIVVLIPLAVFIHPWKKRYLIVVVGGIYGYVLYFINVLLFPVIVPLLATTRDLVMLVDYTLFGVMAAWFYAILRDRAVASVMNR